MGGGKLPPLSKHIFYRQKTLEIKKQTETDMMLKKLANNIETLCLRLVLVFSWGTS